MRLGCVIIECMCFAIFIIDVCTLCLCNLICVFCGLGFEE